MPVEFYELPQNTPSVAYLPTAVGYCTQAEVQALNMARPIGIGSNPGPSQVAMYIMMVAGEIDAVLTQKGYEVPVNVASWPSAGALLMSINAKGAAWMVEEAAPNSINVDRAKVAYDQALKLLSDAKFAMDADMEETRVETRAPFLTYQPTGRVFDPAVSAPGGQSGDGISAGDSVNNPRDPYFSRQQQF